MKTLTDFRETVETGVHPRLLTQTLCSIFWRSFLYKEGEVSIADNTVEVNTTESATPDTTITTNSTATASTTNTTNITNTTEIFVLAFFERQ